MILSVMGVMYFLPSNGNTGNFYGFLTMFIILFALTGIGNGSTFRMIPVIFLQERQHAAEKDEASQRRATLDGAKEAAAVLGFSGAVGAYGGFFIPKSFGTSIDMTGTPHAALAVFIAFYLSCLFVTWWWYSRRHAPMPC